MFYYNPNKNHANCESDLNKQTSLLSIGVCKSVMKLRAFVKFHSQVLF
jgi:hypothetical protein